MASRHKKGVNPSQKFYKITLTLGASLVILFVTFSFFGPKIGSVLLLISKNRNAPPQEDIIPPSTPLFSKVPEATNKEKVSLNGIAQPGSKINLYVNGPKKYTTTSNSEGLFTFVDISLNKGKNTLFAKAVDTKNNESKKSETLKITYDNENPEIEIIEPKNGQEITNLNKRITIKGKTNEKADVTINGRYAIVKADNNFELLLGVNEGTVEIEIKAKDTAGNETTETLTVTYKKE